MARHLSNVGTSGNILDKNILLDARIIWHIPLPDVHLGIHDGELQSTPLILRP